MNLQRFSLAAAAVLAALSLTACSSIDLEKDKDAASVTDATDVERMLNAKDGPLAKREIYFDFDSYSVSPQYMPIVTNHAKFLANNKNVKVMLEGNTDARGSREYNLALGQKRSEAVKQRMTLMGVNPDQVESISFGKERPKALGDTEEDYAQNRRVDIHYLVGNK